jgi:hypothetical protein
MLGTLSHVLMQRPPEYTNRMYKRQNKGLLTSSESRIDATCNLVTIILGATYIQSTTKTRERRKGQGEFNHSSNLSISLIHLRKKRVVEVAPPQA